MWRGSGVWNILELIDDHIIYKQLSLHEDMRNGHSPVVSAMERADSHSFAAVWAIFHISPMKCGAGSTCFKTRISQSCYLIPSDELEPGPSSAQRESTLHELLPNIISAISPLSWTSEHVKLEINTSKYHGRVFEAEGFIFMFSSLPLSLSFFLLFFLYSHWVSDTFMC